MTEEEQDDFPAREIYEISIPNTIDIKVDIRGSEEHVRDRVDTFLDKRLPYLDIVAPPAWNTTSFVR